MKSHLHHLIVAVLVFIGTLVGYYFWYAVVAEKSAYSANLQRQIATKTETMSRIAGSRETLAEIASEGAILQSYFVPETGIVAFINELEARGRVQGAVAKVSSVSTSTIGTHQVFLLSLDVEGPFDAILRTVGTIEYAPYDLSISELTLMHDDKENWHAGLKLLVGSTKGIARALTAP